MIEKDEKQLTQRTRVYLLLYAIVLVVVSFVLVLCWDVLRQEAGYASLLARHGSVRRLSIGSIMIVLPALPGLGLMISLRSPQTTWHQRKWIRILAVHLLPLCLLGVVIGLFYTQYQQLTKEIAVQQKWKENQEELQDIRRKIEEQNQQEIPEELPSILPAEE